MSKMSDLSIDIQERLEMGQKPQDIAIVLNIPLSWIAGVQEMVNEYHMDAE